MMKVVETQEMSEVNGGWAIVLVAASFAGGYAVGSAIYRCFLK